MKATGLALCKGRARQQHTVNSGLNKNREVEKLFAAEPMGDFVFLSVPGYTDVLDVSFVLFPWPETLWRVLAVSLGPPGNTQFACVLLAELLKVTVGEQAAEDPRVTSPWGLSEFQPPSACTSDCHGGRQPSPRQLLIQLWEGERGIAVCCGSGV